MPCPEVAAEVSGPPAALEGEYPGQVAFLPMGSQGPTPGASHMGSYAIISHFLKKQLYWGITGIP